MSYMKTLADMTAEEQKECVGMWCDVQMMGGGTAQFIFSEPRPGPRMGAYLTEPGAHMPWTAEYEAITPRFDLPRAWNPDGTPPEHDWQYADYTPGINRGFYSVDEVVEKGPELPDSTTRARRLVGEWETDND